MDSYSGLFKRAIKVDDMRGGLNPGLDEKWTWIAMMDRLSGGDITKHDIIWKRNYIECLNLMSYWHERDKHLEEMQKRNTKRK